MAEAQRWYVLRENSEQGPLTTAQLKALVAQGRLEQSTRVRLEGKEPIQAGRIKGLFPSARSGQVLVRSETGQEALSRKALERLIDQDQLPFDRPVVSLDGGENWLRPAEAMLALNTGKDISGYSDPKKFNAFADKDVRAFRKDGVVRGTNEQSLILRPWGLWAGVTLGTAILPAWLDARRVLMPWEIFSSPEAGLGGLCWLLATVIAAVVLVLSRKLVGMARGAVVGGCGLVLLLVSLVALWGPAHAAQAWTQDLTTVLIVLSWVASIPLVIGNYLRAYYPVEPLPRVLSIVGAVLFLGFSVVVVGRQLSQGWFGLAFADWPFFLWLSGLALWILYGGLAASAVLALVNALRKEGVEQRANLAYTASMRGAVVCMGWIIILPLWLYAPQVVAPRGIPWLEFISAGVGTLRGLLYLGGALFLCITGAIDLIRQFCMARDALRRETALALAKAAGNSEQ